MTLIYFDVPVTSRRGVTIYLATVPVEVDDDAAFVDLPAAFAGPGRRLAIGKTTRASIRAGASHFLTRPVVADATIEYEEVQRWTSEDGVEHTVRHVSRLLADGGLTVNVAAPAVSVYVEPTPLEVNVTPELTMPPRDITVERGPDGRIKKAKVT